MMDDDSKIGLILIILFGSLIGGLTIFCIWIGEDERNLEYVDEGYVQSMFKSSGAGEIMVNNRTYKIDNTSYETLDIGDYVIIYDEFFLTHPIRIIEPPNNSTLSRLTCFTV